MGCTPPQRSDKIPKNNTQPVANDALNSAQMTSIENIIEN